MFLSSNPQEQADIQVLAQQVDLVELLNQLIAESDLPIEQSAGCHVLACVDTVSERRTPGVDRSKSAE
jgi:hypothetical protein